MFVWVCAEMGRVRSDECLQEDTTNDTVLVTFVAIEKIGFYNPWLGHTVLN